MADPIITGQLPLTTPKNVNLSVNLTDLIVNDATFPDGSGTNWMIEADAPSGSSYDIDNLSGIDDHYTFHPHTDVIGTLLVPTRVSNGGVTWSNWFNVNIIVSMAPEITGQLVTPKVNLESYFTLNLLNLIVRTNKTYPNGFRLSVLPGVQYTVISTADDYGSAKIQIDGDLNTTTRSINVKVYDGTTWSNTYQFTVNVIAKQQRFRPVGYNVNLNRS
ncbi:MAG: hypothetical protein Q7R33_09655 [Nitrosarchaeum sp.]|nr:hypothetical protein [Nitrosarchaeum sp.]